MRVQISPSDIVVGKALESDLYNHDGRRIFRKGFVVHTEEGRQRILKMHLFFEPQDTAGAAAYESPSRAPAKPAAEVQMKAPHHPRRRKVIYDFKADETQAQELIGGNVFRFLDYCVMQAQMVGDGIAVKGKTDQLEQIRCLAQNINHLYAQAPEACLGSMHLEFEHPYSSLHPVYCAVLCNVVADGLRIGGARRESLIDASLTANLGMYEYHDRLVNCVDPLSAEEKTLVRTHPQKSCQLLEANGVTDELWLQIVEQHHERGDGQGYPKGLTRDQIVTEAAIVAVVDTYLSMVMPRAYRKAMPPKHAMQNIYKTAVAEDDTLKAGLIKQLGVYPPGSLVRLRNQEIGIVTERNPRNSAAPVVACLGVIGGRTYQEPVVRHTDNEFHRIVDPFISDQPVEVDLNDLWDSEIAMEFASPATAGSASR